RPARACDRRGALRRPGPEAGRRGVDAERGERRAVALAAVAGARWLRVLPSGGIGGVVPGDRMTCEVDVQIAGAAGGRESDLRAQRAEHQLPTEDRDEE